MLSDVVTVKVVSFCYNNTSFLVGAFLSFAFVYRVFAFFSKGRKKGKNPLVDDYRRPPEPFVHDAKMRDAVVKQRFKPEKVPEHLDAIIIGSGAGGLTAGALLTRGGKKVLVLEQHDQAGGCCHSFVEKGFEFDTGVHYCGKMFDGSPERTLLDQLTCGQLRWAKLDDSYDIVTMGKPPDLKMYPMKTGVHRYTQNLIDMFPHEKEAILKYMDLVMDAADCQVGRVLLKVLRRKLIRFLVNTGLYRLIFKCYRKNYLNTTLQQVLDKLTNNKELKTVLSYMFLDYGVLPKDVPFVLHAFLVEHFFNGGYYPISGTSEIAFHLVQAIQKGGGRVLVQAPVSKILCNAEGRAIGVRVGKNEVDIHARSIISDAGALNTFKKLLPENVAKSSEIYPIVDKVGPSYSFITAFIGIEGSSADLKLPACNIWHHNLNDTSKCMSDFLSINAENVTAEPPCTFISFPSAKDPEWENKYPARWEWFQEWQDEKVRHRGDQYEGIKDVLGRKLWQQCVNLFPHLDGKKVFIEVGTPVTNQFYLGGQHGEMYGMDQGLSRYSIDAVTKLRHNTDIKGLYLTGQDTMACGFTTAVWMGLFCACQVLGRDIYMDLLALMRKLNDKENVVKKEFSKKAD